ncbi:MAG: hypothetical protein K0Q72_1770 [Armatimonadetes bacterium]|jgi:hypothetical protein|nr:hypothetical protein [Armatimonadota bacterium]
MSRAFRLPLRTAVWLGSALLGLGLYAVRAAHFPRRTTVGVEHRLFGGSYVVWPVPSGSGWLVVQDLPTPSPAIVYPSPLAMLQAKLESFGWPDDTGTGRRLTPFREEGTWAVGPLGLRRVWRFPTTEINEEQRWLIGPERMVVLDLATRRTYRGDQATALTKDLPSAYDEEDDYDQYYGETNEGPDAVNSDALALVELPAMPPTEKRVNIGGRKLLLLSSDPATPGGPLYAVSDDAAPRVLHLADNAMPVKLSDDGRTLFFDRGGVLWRLDLRKPLPELLDEVVPEGLPDES